MPTTSGRSAATRLAEDEEGDDEEDREGERLGPRQVLLHLRPDLLADDGAAAERDPRLARRALLRAAPRCRRRRRRRGTSRRGRWSARRGRRAPAGRRRGRRSPARRRGRAAPRRRARSSPLLAASRPAAPSRTRAITSGAADAPVAAVSRSRAWTASAAGGSKSSCESRRPATGPPSTPASATARKPAASTARRRRKSSWASESSIPGSDEGCEWLLSREAKKRAGLRPPPSPGRAGSARPGPPSAAAHGSAVRRSRSQVERGDHVEQHPVREELPHLVGLRAGQPADELRPARRSTRGRRPGSPGPSRRRSSASGRAACGGPAAGRCRPRPSSCSASAGGTPRAASSNVRADALVHLGVAGEEEPALGAEEPEQVGLRDAGVARDRLGRGAVVAAEREVPIAISHDLLAPLARRTCGG